MTAYDTAKAIREPIAARTRPGATQPTSAEDADNAAAGFIDSLIEAARSGRLAAAVLASGGAGNRPSE
ncbi:hypothetical protein [Sphingomonas floccifaciens]|uniref:hypothetical protein n=1 Tax=Sphingomonas floccifaciens TaxID=1844115 RepID=UPI0036D3DF9B